MEPVSTVTSFLGILKDVINFDPVKKGTAAFYKDSHGSISDPEARIKDMAARIVLNKPRTTSIARQVENSVAHYPLVVSDGISNETAINLAKINEGRVAEYIKTILQTDRSVIDLDNYQGDIGNFMNNFKSNNAFRMVDVDELIKEGCEQKDYLEICESLLKDDCFYQMLEEKLSTNDKLDLLKAGTMVTGKVAEKVIGGKAGKAVGGLISQAGSEVKELINTRDKRSLDKIVDRNVRINKSENQTVPTVIEANVTITKGSAIGEKRVYMAVKSMLHIIPGTEMMDAIAGRIAKGDFLTKFIKWYTGEISFIRDLFLNVDEIKRIEGGTSSKGQTAIDKMFDFTRKGSVNSILNNEHFIPTTTLAISIDDVSYLKSISGVNLAEEIDAIKVMKDLGLLAIMIVDELKDILMVFDNAKYSSYEVYSLSGKTKEDKSTTKLMQAFFGSKKV